MIFFKNNHKKRVLIVGAGVLKSGGDWIREKYEVLVVDKQNYFTFQPLLYQVATGGLEPDSVAYPLRKIFQKKSEVMFRLAEAERLDPAQNVVHSSIGLRLMTFSFLPWDQEQTFSK